MIRILILALWLPAAALAQDLPQPLSDTVSDFADMLDAAQEAQLNETLVAARAETGVHIVVVTMDKTQNYGGSGQSIETYAKNLFNLWGVGDVSTNDGILMLVAKDDREMRIALGDAYDPVYDGLAQRVIDSEMLPSFRDDLYPEGIQAGVAATIDRIARPFAAHQMPEAVASPSKFPMLGLFGLGAVGVLLLAFRQRIGDQFVRFRSCPSCGQRQLNRSREIENAATQQQSGTGIQITRCANCSHETRDRYTLAPLGRSNSGTGGFGGGRSSGGGASGRW